MIHLFKKSFGIVLGLSLVSSVFAKQLSSDIIASDAAIKIYVFKDPTVDAQGSSKQFLYATQNGTVITATIVSTGDKDLSPPFSIETKSGTYSIESLAKDDFTNPTEHDFDWLHTAIIFEQNQHNEAQLPANFRGQYSQAIHNYPSSGVTGARASHGCVRAHEDAVDTIIAALKQNGGKSAGVVYIYSADQQPALSEELTRQIRAALQ